MFYAHFVLAKKGPLARIWLAAHWDKKLTKAHVFETNIEKSVDGILQPKVKMALRTSGHLLLGVVRIYSRKAKYLLADCNEAFVKIKMAFRPGMVDLPEEHREAAVTAITLPEVFHDFDTAMPELKDVDIEAQFSLNQSRAEEITMREDYGSLALVSHDQGFGDMSFDAEPPELLRHAVAIEPSLEESHMLFTDGPGMEPSLEPKEKEPVAGPSVTVQAMDIDRPIRDDGFGGPLGEDIISGGLFEGGLFDEAPMGEVPVPEVSAIAEQEVAVSGAPPSVHEESDEDMGDHFGGPPSPMGGIISDESRPASPVVPGEEIEGRISVVSRRFTPAPPTVPEELVTAIEEAPPLQEQITLLHDEEESFALAPVDASALKGFTKAKRKRKLIVDEVKNISGEEMKAQLSDTSDIITTLDLAPPTKRLMHWKETGGVEKLFALPGRPIPARVLFKNYQRHLTSKSYDHEDFGRLVGEEEGIPLEQIREPAELEAVTLEQTILSKRISRKRKAPVEEEIRPTPPMEVTPEAVEVPSIVTPTVPTAVSPVPPEVSLPAESSEISGLVSAVEEAEMVPQVPEAPLLPTEIPPIPTAEILPAPEELAVPPTPVEPEVALPPTELPQMENMGYDQAEPQVPYMGYDEHLPPAVTPGAVSERGPATPWNHEDYEFPPSVGPQEEQQVDETYEQFEERVLNKRAAHMYQVIKSKLETKDRLTLSEMAYKNNRKQVAQKFYTLLVLKKFQVLELNQEYSYAEIVVTKGPKFENPAL